VPRNGPTVPKNGPTVPKNGATVPRNGANKLRFYARTPPPNPAEHPVKQAFSPETGLLTIFALRPPPATLNPQLSTLN
jgi:hypothetical protein